MVGGLVFDNHHSQLCIGAGAAPNSFDRTHLMSSKSETLWSIQYLRALAALGVIIFHSLSDTGDDFEFGAIGIHLFFVISGFLMWSTTCRNDTGVRHFVSSRVRRIVPIYWIATFLTVLLNVWFPGYLYQASGDPIHVITSLLFIPHSGVEGGTYPVLYQGWTLQYEMFFYAVFAFSLLFGIQRRLGILTAIITSLTLIGLIFPNSPNPLIATYTDPFCMEFLMGAWAAKLCSSRAVAPQLAAAILVSGMAGLWLGFHYEIPLGTLGWGVTAIAASSIITGSVLLERHGLMPRWSWLRYGGEASYSLYIFQEFGFFVASRFTDDWPVLAKAATFCAFAIATGVIMFAFVERPIQRRFSRRVSA